MPRLFLPIAALGFVASACAAPQAIVRLYPAGSEVTWGSGGGGVGRAQGGIRAAVAFDHQQGNSVGFRVEIQNDSPERVEIDPKDMQFVTCSGESVCSARQPAIDSERTSSSTAAMRRTTLLMGHGVAGLVYVPLAVDAEYVWLGVRAGGHDFWFRFKQAVTLPPGERDEPSETNLWM